MVAQAQVAFEPNQRSWTEIGPTPERRTVQALQKHQGFLAQALHQPSPATCLAPNNGQPPAFSPALP